jgi:thiamine biosynthesis lipoprotein
VDCAIKELKEKGIDAAIVNAGGDIYCLGKKFNKPWKVGIQNPRDKNKLLADLELKDSAVTTSGDYQQFMESEGKRYSHIINPKTGYPVDNGVISVTVLAKDTLTADIVATSIFLLGKEKGIETFENYKGVEKIIVIEQGDIAK